MKNKVKSKSNMSAWIFGIIVLALICLILVGAISRSKSADELTPNSKTHPHVFSYAPDGESIWLGTHTGLYEYQDTKWKRTVPETKNDDVMGLEINPQKINQIVISGHGFVKRTEDGGNTWITSEQGMPNQPKPDTPDAHQLTQDPKDPNHLFALLATQGENLFESKDGGKTWAQAGSLPPTTYSIAVVPDNSSALLAATEKGLYRYEFINGQTKETMLNSNPAFQVISTASNEVMVMNEGSFVRSSDLNTWNALKIDLNGEMPLGVKISHKDPNRFVIVTDKYSVYESRDKAGSWKKL